MNVKKKKADHTRTISELCTNCVGSGDGLSWKNFPSKIV